MSRQSKSRHSSASPISRRSILGAGASAAALLAMGGQLNPAAAWANLLESATPKVPAAPESLVKVLFEALTDDQKKKICFDWDHKDKEKGLLRTRVENNWTITPQHINSDFYTKDQRQIVREIYEGMLNPEWIKKVDQQLKDDAGGWGNAQSIAIFGKPGDGKSELVMTGRHLTIRCDGNSAEHVAFGGPIFHGHAAQGFHEKADHPGNIFWPQAQAANKLYTMLDGKQQEAALVKKGMPEEEDDQFRSPKDFQGIPIKDLAGDQREQIQKVLAMLVEPYRKSDADEALTCLKKQGGLDACSLAFYEEADIGNDKVWDNWRIEGPAFVWHFRGKPHVHIWVNVADDPSVKLNSNSSAIM